VTEESPTAGGDEVPEPIMGLSLAKAAASAAATESSKAVPGLMTRVLGPAADEVGEAVRRWTAFRVGNVERIVTAADRKTDGARAGQVPPRIAHRLLEEGSFCDDELMAEYLGGVLAGSRTPNGRDDRAIGWSELVASLSSLQVRAHFLLYRAWAEVLHGQDALNLWDVKDQRKAYLHVDLPEFVALIISDSDVEPNKAIGHAIPGLLRHDLLGDHAWGKRENTNFKTSPYPYTLVVQPSPSGMELFGWSLGRAGLTPRDFLNLDDSWDASLPRLVKKAVPSLPSAGATPDDKDHE
jgi:hypothetical protein